MSINIGKGGRDEVNLQYSGIKSLKRKHGEPLSHMWLTGIHMTGIKFGKILYQVSWSSCMLLADGETLYFFT